MKKLEKNWKNYCNTGNTKYSKKTYQSLKKSYVAGYKKAKEDIAFLMRTSNKVNGFSQEKYKATDDEQKLFIESYIKEYIEKCGDEVKEKK